MKMKIRHEMNNSHTYSLKPCNSNTHDSTTTTGIICKQTDWQAKE